MNRDDAFKILTTFLTNENLIRHCLAAEVAMRALYARLNPEFKKEEEDVWGITGLLHDADYELSKGHPELHGLLLFDRVPNQIPENIAHAIKAHNYSYTKVIPETPMDWAITCADQLTGLIVACALIHPEKKLTPLTPEFVIKRLNQNGFAKGADRTPIKQCEEKLGIPLEEFVTIVLTAMKSISPDLGL